MLTKIINYFGTDGLLHALASLFICALLGAFMPWWAAALATLAAGAAKELIYDKWMKRGTAEWKDIVADLAGTAMGALALIAHCI